MSHLSELSIEDDLPQVCSCQSTTDAIDRKVDAILLKLKTLAIKLETMGLTAARTKANKTSSKSTRSSRKPAVDSEDDDEVEVTKGPSNGKDHLGLFAMFTKLKKGGGIDRKEYMRSVCFWPSNTKVFCDPKLGATAILGLEEKWLSTLRSSRKPEGSNGRTSFPQVTGKRGAEGTDQRYFGLTTIGAGFVDLSSLEGRHQPGFLLSDYEETIKALRKSALKAWKPFVTFVDQEFRLYAKTNGYLLATSFTELVDNANHSTLKPEFKSLTAQKDKHLCKTPIKIQAAISSDTDADLADDMTKVKLDFEEEAEPVPVTGSAKRKATRSKTAGSPAKKRQRK